MVNANPAIDRLRGNGDYQDWAAGLVLLADSAGLEPLSGVLKAIAGDGFSSLEPLHTFESGPAAGISSMTYLRAIEVVEQANPYSAFVLLLVVLRGWSISYGEGLYRRPQPGTPSYECWRQIPYACARTCLQVGALEAAGHAITLGYDMLMMTAARYFWADELRAEINRHRRLAFQHRDRLDTAMRNLADDLQSGSLPREDSFRAEIGALFWTLGWIPESELLKSSGRPTYVPSKRQFFRMVRRSLERIPDDPLVQAIWLEMKDKDRPFHLRSHELLFGKMNLVYPKHDRLLGFVSHLVDPLEIYRTYASTLIGWFRGTLSEEQIDDYLSLCKWMGSMPEAVDWEGVLGRIAHLGYLIGLETGFLAIRKIEREVWRSQVAGSRSVLQRVIDYPDHADLGNILDSPLFQLIETEFASNRTERDSEPNDCRAAFEAIESYRAAALEYWLTVTPPLSDNAPLAPLIEREQASLSALRGAYFLMLYPLLPAYFRYHDLAYDDYQRVHENPEQYALDPDNGRRQYHEITAELGHLWTAMEAVNPDYARKRKSPSATWADLLRTMNAHKETAP
jgi:hypothetical protein